MAGPPAAVDPFPTTSISPATQSREAMGQHSADRTAGHGQPTQAQPDEPATYPTAAHGLAAGSAQQSAGETAAGGYETPPKKRQKLRHGHVAASPDRAGPAESVADAVAPAGSADQGPVTPGRQHFNKWPNISQESPTAVVARDDVGVLAVMPPASSQPGAVQVRVEMNPLVLISWMRSNGADAAGMANLPAGLLDRIGVPTVSAREKERLDIDALLRTLWCAPCLYGC